VILRMFAVRMELHTAAGNCKASRRLSVVKALPFDLLCTSRPPTSLWVFAGNFRLEIKVPGPRKADLRREQCQSNCPPPVSRQDRQCAKRNFTPHPMP
jgi:hypothetical protein